MLKARLLIIVVMLGFIFLSGVYSSAEGVYYSKTFSWGLFESEDVYFLLDYRVSRPRRPLWFILFIERPGKVYYHRIFFFRYNPEEDELVREEFPPGVWVSGSRIKERDGKIIFAYRAGFDEEYR